MLPTPYNQIGYFGICWSLFCYWGIWILWHWLPWCSNISQCPGKEVSDKGPHFWSMAGKSNVSITFERITCISVTYHYKLIYLFVICTFNLRFLTRLMTMKPIWRILIALDNIAQNIVGNTRGDTGTTGSLWIGSMA